MFWGCSLVLWIVDREPFLRVCANGSDGSYTWAILLHVATGIPAPKQLAGRQKEHHIFEVLAPLPLIRRHLSKQGAPSIFYANIFQRTLRICDTYRGLQFRLNVTRIRGFSLGTVHLEKAYANVLLCFRISA